jgi:hypothetical protein
MQDVGSPLFTPKIQALASTSMGIFTGILTPDSCPGPKYNRYVPDKSV